MPIWQPDWTDVRFDHGACEAAAAQCEAVAARLRSGLDERRSLAETARAEWRGVYRDDFDASLPTLTAEAERLDGDLRRLATDLRAASVEAQAEQRRRMDDRAEWQRQADTEAAGEEQSSSPAIN